MLNSAEHEIYLLINVKMPTIVGILILISLINTIFEILKARNFFICRYFSFYEQLKVSAQLSIKSFITSGPGLEVIKLEYSLRLKIKHNDWLVVDTCPQAANH